MKNWKKSLVAAGILATVLAGSAFAATEAEDASTQQRGLDYNNKIEQQAPEMEKGRPPHCFHKNGHHRPGPRHDGGFRGPKGAPGHHDGKFRAHHKGNLTRPGKLTPEQRQQLTKE